MFLKAQYKVLNENNKVEQKIILVEMEYATEDTPQEERETIYYTAVRKAINILTPNNEILMGGQFEIVDCKVNKGEEYNLQMKSKEVQVEDEDIYLLK
jgi:hypothetical protein